MAEDVIVQWEQPKIFGMDRSTTWHGSVIAPVKTIQYALVACSIHGQWYGCIWPKGRMSKGIELYAKFPSPERAKQQIERWTQYHWRTIPLWVHPQDRR